MAAQDLEIGELLANYLAGAAQVTTYVADRIRPDALDVKDRLPAIRYETITATPWHNLQGAAGKGEARVQFDCYGRTRREANQVGKAVRDVLDGLARVTLSDSVTVYDCVADVTYDRREPPGDGGQQWRCKRVIDFIVTHSEATPSLVRK